MKHFLNLLLISISILITNQSFSQLSGIKNIPGDYSSLELAIIDLNTLGVGSGGVTINLLAGNPQTAPNGGYVLGGTGSLILSTSTSLNPIILNGNGNSITASATLTSGLLNDAVFKIIGGDYITIQGFSIYENSSNTITDASTNNMTEWGIALLYETTTNGCQNVSILNDSISLGNTYQNTFGIYSNSSHSATIVSSTATATGATGGNHNLIIKSNVISNVNQGIVVVGSTNNTAMNTSVTIGGTTASEGNKITFGLTGTISTYANFTGDVNGIYVRNTLETTVSNNNIKSDGTVISGELSGINNYGSVTAMSGTFSRNYNDNSIELISNSSTNSIYGIYLSSGTSLNTTTFNMNGNKFYGMDFMSSSAAGNVYVIYNRNNYLHTSISNNSFYNTQCKTSGAFYFIYNYSAVTLASGSMNVNSNNLVNGFTKTGIGGLVTFYHAQLLLVGTTSTLGSSKNFLNNNFSNVTVYGNTNVNGYNDPHVGGKKIVSFNTFENISVESGTATLIYFNFAHGSEIKNNTINNISSQGNINAVNCGNNNYNFNYILSNNVISNLTSTGVGGNVYGFNIGGNNLTNTTFNSNLISNLSSTGSNSIITGIYFQCPVTGVYRSCTANSNIIHSLSSSGDISPQVIGMNILCENRNIYSNKIYNLSCTGSISSLNSSVIGLWIINGALSNIYNNVIGDLKAPSADLTDAINGIKISATTISVNNVYSNTIYLNATSSGSNFGTSAIFNSGNSDNSIAKLNLRNNILINESTPVGTGQSVVIRSDSPNPANLSATSNKNLLYAGVPASNRLIYTDGTTIQQSLSDYELNVLPSLNPTINHDLNSFTGETFSYSTPGSFFMSLTGASSNFLKPVSGIITQCENGADSIDIVTTDFSGITRVGSSIDCGAYEFNGINPFPVIVFEDIYPAGNQCVNTSRFIYANITSAIEQAPNSILLYSINGVPQTPITMVEIVGPLMLGEIPIVSPSNAVVSWSIITTNYLGQSTTYTGTSFSDEPLTGVSASASASVSTICSGDSSSLSATLVPSVSNSTVVWMDGTTIVGTGNPIMVSPSSTTTYTAKINVDDCELTPAPTVTLNVLSSSTTSISHSTCSSYTWTQNGTTYTASGSYSDTIPNSVGCDSIITLNLVINQPSSSSLSVSECSSFTWTQNGTTYTTSGSYSDTIPNSVGCDSIITLNLVINQPSSSSLSVTVCSSYTWIQNGTTYTTSGLYSDTIPNSVGCDSIITLNLVINQPSSSSLSVSECSSFTWTQNGTTYTMSGSYSDTIPNSVGCDSIITLNLVINQPSSSSLSVSTCFSYTWTQNGTTYTTSGSYSDTIPNSVGCDSIITLNLVINQPSSSSLSVSACSSYTWTQNGTTYTTSGSYSDTIPNSVGCDSIITLNLVINQPSSSSLSVTACSSYTWTQNGTTYTNSGSYSDTIPNSVGCDSITTLNLVINQPSTSSLPVSECSSFTWIQNGTTYTTSGSYSDTIPNSVGCDSIITLNLIINPSPIATVTYSGDSILTSSTGTAFQWIDCSTNTAITGEISQTFHVLTNGAYAVVVTNSSGCSDTSTCITVNDLSIQNKEFEFLDIYPNPTSSTISIKMSIEIATIELVDSKGKIIMISTIKNGDLIDLTNIESGIYFINIHSNGYNFIKQIIKQ